MTGTRALVIRAITPALLLAASIALGGYVLPDPAMAGLAGEGAGPTLWPNMLRWLVGICSAIWLVRVVWTHFRAPALIEGEAVAAAPYDTALAWLGIAIVLAYGLGITYLGFAVATLLFLVIWSVLGGVRKPLTVAPVAVLGTITLLYVFVALAQMPLDRGRGIFNAATTQVYDAIGIY